MWRVPLQMFIGELELIYYLDKNEGNEKCNGF